MELVSYHYPLQKHSKTPLLIIPLGDIQWTGNDNDVAVRILKETIEYGMDHNAVFIGMGDYIDYSSPSNRQALRSAGLYDNALMVHENAAIWLVDDLYDKILKPTKNRWLGLLEGHHYSNLQSGITTDQLLCQKLGTKFLGSCAMVGLHYTADNNSRLTVNIWCHHGQGSGLKPGTPINKLDNIVADWEADIFLMGHMTKQAAAPIQRLYPYWPRDDGKAPPSLRHKTKLLVGTGGYGKGYIEHSKQGLTPRGTYVEIGMMRPASLGSPRIWVKPYKERYNLSDGSKSHHLACELRVDVGG